MKKSKLMELLNSIEGDPDIMLWNGYASDYTEIRDELVEIELVKHSREKIGNLIKLEFLRDCVDEGLSEKEVVNKLEKEHHNIEEMIDKSFKKHYSEWEIPNRYFTEEEISNFYAHRKTVYLLQAKLMGKSQTDRVGTTYY